MRKLFLLLSLLLACACGSKHSDLDISYFGESPAAYPSTAGREGMSRPQQSGLKAAYADDNAQFNGYLDFLEKFKNVNQINFPVQERLVLQINDLSGRGIPDANVVVSSGHTELMRAKTYSDGRTLFFPCEYRYSYDKFDVTVSYGKLKQTFSVSRQGARQQVLTMPVNRQPSTPVPVDILFILDTTGSMGEEITRLKNTLLIIHDNLRTMPVETDVRFGMVMYKDRNDEYVTRKIKFTDDAEEFQKEISKIRAYGGGDRAEDMQAAMEEAVSGMKWRDNGVKLAYLITDADAHFDYGQKFTLLDSAIAARGQGVKIFSVGTGGLPIEGEISLRQLAQYTMGKYIFLTYGERGESEGGASGSVSHHTGENFVSENLEAIIIRFAKEEIGNYAMRSLANADDDYFAATQGDDKLAVLAELFSQMISQLASYSSINITAGTTAAVIPLSSSSALEANAEYFTEHLSQAAGLYRGWRAVERIDIQKILDEHAFSLSGLVDGNDVFEAGSMLGAELLVLGTVYEKNGAYEIYLKLVRTESGEVLSVTRAKVAKDLGL